MDNPNRQHYKQTKIADDGVWAQSFLVNVVKAWVRLT